jgi:hypothetical protein
MWCSESPGLSLADMRAYLEHVADRRLAQFGIEPLYGSACRRGPESRRAWVRLNHLHSGLWLLLRNVAGRWLHSSSRACSITSVSAGWMYRTLLAS